MTVSQHYDLVFQNNDRIFQNAEKLCQDVEKASMSTYDLLTVGFNQNIGKGVIR